MFQDLILKFIVFFLPTQLGFHFWPEFTRVAGIKIDYYSPTIYFVDLLIFAYFFVNSRYLLIELKKHLKPLLVFICILTINIFFSLNPLNSLLQYMRIIEYFLLFLILAKVPNLWSKISNFFIYSLVTLAIVQFLQFFYQKSLNGPLYLLGERFFNSDTTNLAHIQLNNHFLIRVPSLFPHPNALAGYMVLSLVILNQLGSSQLPKIITYFSIFLSFSKSVYISILVYLSKINLGKKIIILYCLLSTLEIIIPRLNTGFNSIDSRSIMISNYTKISPQLLITGVGLGNYPTALSLYFTGSQITPSNLQPVHNLMLLLIAEIGLPTTLLLFYFLFKNYKQRYYQLLLIVLITSLFDHYWLTIPQNKLLLVLSLALLR